MKTLYNILSIIFVLLYVAGVLFGVYYLTYDATKIQRVFQVFPELVYLLVALSLVGILGFLFLFLRKESSVEIIYTTSQMTLQSTDTTSQYGNQMEASTGEAGIAKQIYQKIKQESNNTSILEALLRAICHHLEVGIGAIYVRRDNVVEMHSSYALYRPEGDVIQYQKGEGLVGQVAKDGKPIKLSKIPEGYLEVVSGLGSSYPNFLVLFPIKNMHQEVIGVIELATFKNVSGQELLFLEEMALLLAREVESIIANV